MSIATVVGAWAAGSLLLGLLLGSVFRTFAARRHAEEKLFAWLEDLRTLAVLHRGVHFGGPETVSHRLRGANSSSLSQRDDTESRWSPGRTPRGRMVQ